MKRLKPVILKYAMKRRFTGVMLKAASMFACIILAGCVVPEITATTPSSPPAINYFTADSVAIQSGEAVNLNWDTLNADSVQIEPGIGNVPATGTFNVSPASSIQYTLTASGPGGQVSSTVSIQVTPAERGPECMSITCDPVTGRNADIAFTWEQMCLCTEYQLQISKDARFTMLIYDRIEYTPYSVTSPGLIYLAGGILECGHTYYVRVRCTAAATGQRIHSPWSNLGCLTINSGLPVGGANK